MASRDPVTRFPVTRQIPILCPVCLGRGWVDGDFYLGLGSATSTAHVDCRRCGGTGTVWGYESEGYYAVPFVPPPQTT